MDNKYDEEFIKPYLERYAVGEFNEYELNQLKISGINREFISCISINGLYLNNK